jgi:hypothetical protein
MNLQLIILFLLLVILLFPSRCHCCQRLRVSAKLFWFLFCFSFGYVCFYCFRCCYASVIVVSYFFVSEQTINFLFIPINGLLDLLPESCLLFNTITFDFFNSLIKNKIIKFRCYAASSPRVGINFGICLILFIFFFFCFSFEKFSWFIVAKTRW